MTPTMPGKPLAPEEPTPQDPRVRDIIPPVWETSQHPSELSLHDYANLLRRRKPIVLLMLILALLVGLSVTFLTKPTYRATTRIRVEGPEVTIAQYSASDPLSNLFMPEVGHDIATQIQVLQGTQVLADAFQEVGVPGNAVRLDMNQVGSTDFIDIAAESAVPAMAEQIARQMPLTYRTYISGNRKNEIRTALKSSQEKLFAEEDRLTQAERALQGYKERIRMPDIAADQRQKIVRQGIAVEWWRKVEVELAAAEARLWSALTNRLRQPDFIESTTTTVSQERREQIQDQIAQLKVYRQESLNLFQPDHFQVRQIDTLIAQQQQRWERTPITARVTKRISNPDLALYDQRVAEAYATLAAARATVESARGSIVITNAALHKICALETRWMDLERELITRQKSVAALTHTVNLLDLRNKVTRDPVTVITPPSRAQQVAPDKFNNLAYSVIVGLMLGLLLALVQEFFDDRIRSPEEARRLLRVPSLGYVPLIDEFEVRLLNQRHSSSFVLESYRLLRNNVRFATVGTTIKSLLITSTMPGEGKSLTAANLAVAMALDGRRVILVDADLRIPTLHTKFGMRQSPGLTSVLVGHTALEEALRETTVPNLRLLMSGPLPPNPAELLNSRPMRQIHQQLETLADVVIFDSPPCLAAAEAQVLAGAAGGVLYVIELGETRKSRLRYAAGLLEQANANVLGAIFNKIKLATGQELYYSGYFNYYLTLQGNIRRHGPNSEFEALLAHKGVAATNTPISMTDMAKATPNSV
jgi:polysaccharide biosynthesis transport protein